MPDQPFVAVADGSGYALARASGEVLWPLDGKNVWPMPAKAALWLSTTTPKAARDLLGWAKLPGGWATGGFMVKLFDTIAAGDTDHRAALGLAFPAAVAAYELYHHVYGSPGLLAAYVEHGWAPDVGRGPDEPSARLADAAALDRMSEWLCQPDPEGQWGSACDYIEMSAALIDKTGRSTDPVVPADDDDDEEDEDL